MGPGRYVYGGITREVSADGRVSEPDQPHLAGAAAMLDRGVVNAFLSCDVTFEQVWAMASTTPARSIGLPVPEEVTVAVGEDGFQRQ
jgi:N-acetylglucosamine-6-phosphate deacetylase